MRVGTFNLSSSSDLYIINNVITYMVGNKVLSMVMIHYLTHFELRNERFYPTSVVKHCKIVYSIVNSRNFDLAAWFKLAKFRYFS